MKSDDTNNQGKCSNECNCEEAVSNPANAENITTPLTNDAKVNELTNIAKQAMADLANYKRRVEEEKASFAQFANANLILELLQIVDNFDRALSSIPDKLQNNEWIKGIEGIDQQFHTILKKQGLTPIETIGKKLDLTKHAAVMQGPGEKDIIVEELEKGYIIGEKVLRPAKVKIGNGE